MTESASIQSVRVRVVQSAAEFASLADSWESLQKDATSTSVFQTFDWQCLWWTTCGRDQPLRLLLATEGNRLVGILPLYIQTVPAMRLYVRLLRPIGIGGDTSPDDLGPMLAAGCEDRVVQALSTAVMQLSDMLPDCAFTALRDDHRCKRKLATGERETAHVTAFRWTVGALAHRARRIVMPAARARVMDLLRKLRHQPTKME